MKINHLPTELPASTVSVGSAKSADRSGASASATALASASAAPSTAAGASASMSVRLSATTQTLASGSARSGTEVFNSQKVQAMRSAIESGTFTVNPGVIADKLLANARDMLQTSAGH